MFSVVINLDGVSHKLDTLAYSAKHLEEPLAKFGGYMRNRAVEKYEAQNFPPLAEITKEQRVSKGLHSMERKLARETRKAQSRAKKKIGGDLAGLVSGTSRGVQNRMAVLAEFQRRHSRTWAGRKAGIDASGFLKPLSVKQAASLDERTKRAVDKAVGKPILGSLIHSLQVEVGAGTVTLRSRTAKEWSEIHNQGGTAGHGAKIPKRETLKVEAHHLEVLGAILKSHLLLAFDDGMHGPGF